MPTGSRHLRAPPSNPGAFCFFTHRSRHTPRLAPRSGDDFEKEACFAIGLLAIKQAHQQRIADAGALPGLVALLKRLPAPHLVPAPGSAAGGVARRAADAITNLAHENISIKAKVRTEGGIPPLVALLESHDSKVQRAAAGALRTLAFKNEDNKNLIVECGALPHLIYMVRDADVDVHYEAVGVLGNLVHSSLHIKKRVLEEGALQPVIGLLSSTCTESQREAALLLGQFATTDPDYKVRIVQRNAVPPLIEMLRKDDPQLREMAAFALGRLAQNPDNQAGICHAGGLKPLLDLLDSKNGSLQHNAAFALYGLADNEDNVAEMVKEGAVQRLLDAELSLQASRDCVTKTQKRLEDKCVGRPLSYLLYLLRPAVRGAAPERELQRRVAVALAHLCRAEDAPLVFGTRGGLDVLLDMVTQGLARPAGAPAAPKVPGDASAQREAARALAVLAADKCPLATADVAPPPPDHGKEVQLDEKFINNAQASDVTFIVEGRDFYAHRIALLAASDTFRAMFDGGYKERDKGAKIEIPNIPLDVFEAMMRCIYTGRVDVTPDIAQELLRAADQYLLEGLKRLCEAAIGEGLTADNLLAVYDLAETYHAPALAQACVLYALKHHAECVAAMKVQGYTEALVRMMPTARTYFETALRPKPAAAAEDSPMPQG